MRHVEMFGVLVSGKLWCVSSGLLVWAAVDVYYSCNELSLSVDPSYFLQYGFTPLATRIVDT